MQLATTLLLLLLLLLKWIIRILAIFWWQMTILFFILLQGPEVGDVSPLLIQPSSQTLAGKNNSFFKWYINLQSTTISMTFSNKPSVQSTEFQTWSCHIDEQQKSTFFE